MEIEGSNEGGVSLKEMKEMVLLQEKQERNHDLKIQYSWQMPSANWCFRDELQR